MRLSRLALLSLFNVWGLLSLSACGSGDTQTLEECGMNGTCPSGFQCNPVDNRCYRNGILPDARVVTPDAMLTPPDTSITQMPATPGNVPNVTFGFSSPTAGATFECKLDTGSFAACTTPKMYTALADGSHTFQVRAVAGGLTDLSPAEFVFVIDATPPVTTITSGPSGDTTEVNPSFGFTSNEDGSTFTCKLDSQTLASCTSPKAYTNLAVGAHVFAAQATDKAGNVGNLATRSFTIVAPLALDTTITSASPQPTTDSTTATFSFTANKDGATFECKLDSGSFEACTTPKTYGDLAESSHTFAVRARLGAEVDDTPATFSWTVDLTGLIAVITSGAEGGVTGPSVTFTYMASDPTATFECGLDGIFEPCDAAGKTFSGLAHQSMHTFRVRAVKGTTVGPPDSRDFVVDALAPVVTITSPMPGSTTHANVTYVFTVSEEADLVCTVDGDVFTPCESGATDVLDDGEHTFVVTATDAVGLTGVGTVTWNVDATGPDVVISSPIDGEITGPVGRVVFSAEGSAREECLLDGRPVQCAQPGYNFTLAGGSHTFEAQAFDASGNPGSPDSVVWTVDADAPVVQSITVVDAEPGSVDVTTTISDLSAILSISCRIDGGDFQPCGAGTVSTTRIGELAPGDHLIEIYAVDVWGNAGLSGVSIDPPATFARLAFTHHSGPGHLVVIGYDYDIDLNNCCAKQGKLPGQCTCDPGPPGPIDELLLNALRLSPSVDFQRGMQVAVYVENTNPNEENYVGFRVNEAFPDKIHPRFVTNPSELAAALDGADMFVILDQNNIDIDRVSVGKQWQSMLQDFLDLGGIVLVTDGYAGDGDTPSRTSDFIYPSLLELEPLPTQIFTKSPLPVPIGLTQPWTNNEATLAYVPCNDADPLYVGSEFDQERLLGYDTSEPWISYTLDGSNLSCQTDACIVIPYSAPVVLHKWFNAVDEGPIGAGLPRLQFFRFPNAQAKLPAPDTFFTNYDLFWHHANGSFEATCHPTYNGTGVYQMDANSSVSLGVNSFNQRYDLSTVMEVQPTEFQLFPQRQNVLVEQVPIGSVTVDPPDNIPADTTAVRIMVGCGEALATVNMDQPVEVGIYCSNTEGTYSIVAEALDVNDDLKGYSILNGADSYDSQTETLPDYITTGTFLHTLDLGTAFNPADVDSVQATVIMYAGGIPYADVYGYQIDDTAPYVFSFWSDAGQGTPGFDTTEQSEFVRFLENTNGFEGETGRYIRGPRPSGFSANLGGSTLLPRITNATFTQLGTSSRYHVAISSAPATFDGGWIELRWYDSSEDFHTWRIAHRLKAYDTPESAGTYWPEPGSDLSDPEISWVELDEADFLDGYLDWRNQYLFANGQLPDAYTVRQSDARPAQRGKK